MSLMLRNSSYTLPHHMDGAEHHKLITKFSGDDALLPLAREATKLHANGEISNYSLQKVMQYVGAGIFESEVARRHL